MLGAHDVCDRVGCTRTRLVAVVLVAAAGIAVVAAAGADASAQSLRPPNVSAERQRAASDERAGKWQAAIGHYLRAHDVDPQPLDLYAIAVDYERLGSLRLAGDFYARYIAAAPGAPDRDRVTRTIADLRQRPSRVAIATYPAGADVAIDGQSAGATPLQLTLPGGTHRVTVELNGLTREQTIELGFGEPAYLAFALGGPAGTLSIGGAAGDAAVFVDDVPIGTLPVTALFAPGAHVLRVTAPGFAPYQAAVQVTADAETHVDAVLTPAVDRPAPGPAPPLDDKADKAAVSFLAGAAIGGEVRSGHFLALGMIGTRLSHVDAIIRVGRANAALTYDFMVRWQILSGPLSPFLAVGYANTAGDYGYLALAGVRYTVAKLSHALFSVVVDGGIRDAPNRDFSTMPHTVVEPIELGIEGQFR